jgi:hypothetical protein
VTATDTTAPAQVGTIYSRSWGYDQTNVDYYEIVSISKTGKTGKARQLKTAAAEAPDGAEGFRQSDRVTAATGPDRFVTDPRCARCSNHHPNEPGWDGHEFTDLYTWKASTDQVTVTTYGDHAYRWDGQPDYQTASGWGH